MKKIFWVPVAAFVSAIVLTACLKNEDVVQCTPNPIERDHESIDSFIAANGIHYVKLDPTYKNIYMGVSDSGHVDSSKAEGDSIIAYTVAYKSFNGNKLIDIGKDSISRNATSGDGLLRFSDIQQTQRPVEYYFLTNVRQGGSVRVIFPSFTNPLGYPACQQQSLATGVVIPAYSQTIADFTLIEVKNGNQ